MFEDRFYKCNLGMHSLHKLFEAATAAEAAMLSARGAQLPAHLRPGLAQLHGLSGAQHALWMGGLDPIAAARDVNVPAEVV